MTRKKGDDWQVKVKGLLKAELRRRNMTYSDLADRLVAVGIEEDRRNLSNKIGRGSFSAAFLCRCLSAIGCRTLRIEDE